METERKKKAFEKQNYTFYQIYGDHASNSGQRQKLKIASLIKNSVLNRKRDQLKIIAAKKDNDIVQRMYEEIINQSRIKKIIG